MTTAIQALVIDLADSVAQLRTSLEHPLLLNLESVLDKAQAALEAVNAWPGGSEALQAALESLPQPQKDETQQLLTQSRADHAVNAELLNLAMQRHAAMQAEAARTAEAATYSSDRGYQMGGSGRLLGKI